MRRAVDDERGLGGAVTLTEDAEDHLLRLAGWRRAQGADDPRGGRGLRALARTARAPPVLVDLATIERAIDVAAVRYDRDGDQHYDVISAFIKSMRGSDVDASLHYLARMIAAGEDPRFIARRIVISAAEDVGMADPSALQTAVAAAQAVALIGMPEARIILAEAVVHLATAPKSNAAYIGDRPRRWPTCARAASARSRRTCATRTTRARRRSATARATCTRTTSRTRSPRSSTCRTSWRAPGTTSRATAGTSVRSTERLDRIRAILDEPGLIRGSGRRRVEWRGRPRDGCACTPLLGRPPGALASVENRRDASTVGPTPGGTSPSPGVTSTHDRK